MEESPKNSQQTENNLQPEIEISQENQEILAQKPELKKSDSLIIDQLEMIIPTISPRTTENLDDPELQEVEEETPDQRTTRRTTLQQNIFKIDTTKPNFLPKSIDIRLLDGNVYILQPINKDLKRVVATQKHPKRMMKALREAALQFLYPKICLCS